MPEGSPTCSSSRLCSLRRASIFPMTSWSRLRSSSMSRCCRPSLSCSAGGSPQGLTVCPPSHRDRRGGKDTWLRCTSELLVPLPDPQLPLLGRAEVRGLHAGGQLIQAAGEFLHLLDDAIQGPVGGSGHQAWGPQHCPRGVGRARTWPLPCVGGGAGDGVDFPVLQQLQPLQLLLLLLAHLQDGGPEGRGDRGLRGSAPRGGPCSRGFPHSDAASVSLAPQPPTLSGGDSVTQQRARHTEEKTGAPVALPAGTRAVSRGPLGPRPTPSCTFTSFCSDAERRPDRPAASRLTCAVSAHRTGCSRPCPNSR